jgi:hypothetical protein
MMEESAPGADSAPTADTTITQSDDAPDTPQVAVRVARGRSETAVVAVDLNTIAQVVRQIRDSWAAPGTIDEIAESLDLMGSARNTFKNKIYNAVKYGVVAMPFNRSKGAVEVVVLPLGEALVDPARSREAGVRAFLHVPLNREMFRRYEGKRLPSDEELDRVIRDELGVTPGQVENARRTLLRSARQAGFFEQGRDRLTIPPGVAAIEDGPMDHRVAEETTTHASEVPPELRNEIASPTRQAQSDTHGASAMPTLPPGSDPAIVTWLQKMPPPGEGWPRAKRTRWYEMFGQLLDYVYDEEE